MVFKPTGPWDATPWVLTATKDKLPQGLIEEKREGAPVVALAMSFQGNLQILLWKTKIWTTKIWKTRISIKSLFLSLALEN